LKKVLDNKKRMIAEEEAIAAKTLREQRQADGIEEEVEDARQKAITALFKQKPSAPLWQATLSNEMEVFKRPRSRQSDVLTRCGLDECEGKI